MTQTTYTFDEYSRDAMRTAGAFLSDIDQTLCAALGMAGEAGEFADEVKKWVYHKHPLDKDKLINEAGDVLWYVALACDALGVSLQEVALKNVSKLWDRYPSDEGFTPEQSLNREH